MYLSGEESDNTPTCIPGVADTSEIVAEVLAPRSVDTGVAGTLVHVRLARHTRPSRVARAMEGAV